MTVAATATRELDINTLLLRAFQLAGLMPMEAAASGAQWDARAAYGRDMLEMIVKHVQSEGNITRDVELYDVTLTAGTASYTMPSDTLSVSGTAMYCEDPAVDTTQLQVRSIDREEYQLKSNKEQQGLPTLYYPARGGSIVLTLWMVPDTTGAVLTVQRQRLLADNSTGGATVDLERSWAKYLIWELAHHFAVSSGAETQRCGYLRSGAKQAYDSCKLTATQSQPDQMYLDHDGGVR